MSLLNIFGFRRPVRSTPGLELHIKITLKGELRCPDPEYRLVGARPPLATLATDVVSDTGDIDLTAVKPLNAENPLTLITFELTGELTFEGHAYPFVFRRPASFAFGVRRKDGGRVSPGLFSAYFPDPRNTAILSVQDQNDDGGKYNYCPRIRAVGAPGLWGKLDPSIINR